MKKENNGNEGKVMEEKKLGKEIWRNKKKRIEFSFTFANGRKHNFKGYSRKASHDFHMAE